MIKLKVLSDVKIFANSPSKFIFAILRLAHRLIQVKNRAQHQHHGRLFRRVEGRVLARLVQIATRFAPIFQFVSFDMLPLNALGFDATGNIHNQNAGKKARPVHA